MVFWRVWAVFSLRHVISDVIPGHFLLGLYIHLSSWFNNVRVHFLFSVYTVKVLKALRYMLTFYLKTLNRANFSRKLWQKVGLLKSEAPGKLWRQKIVRNLPIRARWWCHTCLKLWTWTWTFYWQINIFKMNAEIVTEQFKYQMPKSCQSFQITLMFLYGWPDTYEGHFWNEIVKFLQNLTLQPHFSF